MNTIKSVFSIKDLEKLTGIKAHTIRIWEKRYQLLTPERTDTNIRFYHFDQLQHLLNISFLYNNGYKISKIATLNTQQINKQVKELSDENSLKCDHKNALKLAMLNFNQDSFYEVYNKLIKTKSFQSIFNNVFLPLLYDVGILWQTNTITPAHEHFITSLIRQKTILNTELLQSKNKIEDNRTFVLFLPENEFHDIGLLYINYELTVKGQRTIFLGQSVPISNLTDILSYYNQVIFISHFTMELLKCELPNYLEQFSSQLLNNNDHQFWLLGKTAQCMTASLLPNNIKIFKTFDSLIATI